MCGIFLLLNSGEANKQHVRQEFIKGKKRGPEISTLLEDNYKLTIGFHRLAINGLNSLSNQPIEINGIVLICNGEIYNYKSLYSTMKIEPTTESDCEVIIHLYLKYGIKQTLEMLDGVFAFVLYDKRDTKTMSLYVARDALGIRPLYSLKKSKMGYNYNHENLMGFASELKCLDKFVTYNPYHYCIEQFKPGTYSAFEVVVDERNVWKMTLENEQFFIPTFSYGIIEQNRNQNTQPHIPEDIVKSVSKQLSTAVNRQCGATQRPIACLLSGGLDSSLIAALVNEYCIVNDVPYPLETYSIGLAGSEDLKYAQIMADYLGTKHTNIIVTEQEMFDAIPNVIYSIESYDTTTVRASIGNYLIGQYISKHSDAKVIFNGDGSDELCGGYLYMNKCPDDIEFDKEIRRLLKDIYMFDVLRSDKCISSHGLEPRTPFLDRSFVNHYLSISPYYRNHINFNQCEKFLLRSSFVNSNGKQLLPNEILWRRKEAFSDGVTSKGRSLFSILQEKIACKISKNTGNPCVENIDTEKLYYKRLFDEYYPNTGNILPYYWMPKYTNATDPSARTLELYNEESK
jgi:asparagine synthase (glutamine-hydrolysing)